MIIEVLYFEGCPGADATFAAVARAIESASLLASELQLKRVLVPDARTAGRLRFLGSPSVRVDGRDVEAHADARTDYGLQCRIYPVDGQLVNTPPLAWIEAALERARAGRE